MRRSCLSCGKCRTKFTSESTVICLSYTHIFTCVHLPKSHEIGHGFGLQHRDIDFNNANLGTCMDYTDNFVNTSKPDVVDFQNLSTVYGDLATRRHLRENNKISMPVRQQLEGKILEGRKGNDFRGGDLLHKSKFRELYETDLGDGVFIVTRLLLLIEDDEYEDEIGA